MANKKSYLMAGILTVLIVIIAVAAVVGSWHAGPSAGVSSQATTSQSPGVAAGQTAQEGNLSNYLGNMSPTPDINYTSQQNVSGAP
jgi:flagellar basal body-associated protein FliL